MNGNLFYAPDRICGWWVIRVCQFCQTVYNHLPYNFRHHHNGWHLIKATKGIKVSNTYMTFVCEEGDVTFHKGNFLRNYT